MNEHKHEETKKSQISFADFIPLIIIFLLIFSFTIARQMFYGWDLKRAMADFMGSFFIVFGGFKLINLKGFAEAYATYDIIAKQTIWYAYIYPFLEVGLGIAYFTGWNPFLTNLFTLILMLVSSVGVGIELSKKRTIVCACLGTVFKIPMTYVTLFEDLLMAAMAFIMLLMG